MPDGTGFEDSRGILQELLSLFHDEFIGFARLARKVAQARGYDKDDAPTPRPRNEPMIKAVIFDMDGVLLDSEPIIREAAMRMFAEHGLTVQPDDFTPFVGTGEDRFIGGVAEKYGFPLDPARDKARTYEIYGELAKRGIEPLNGAKEFIAKAKSKGLKLAVASSADQIKIDINLNGIGIPLETFDAVVSGCDVIRKKPHPDGFLKAAEKLGVRPEECLVVEDAVNGVQAAKAAGMKCLALTTSFTPNDLAQADWIAPDLADAPDEDLEW